MTMVDILKPETSSDMPSKSEQRPPLWRRGWVVVLTIIVAVGIGTMILLTGGETADDTAAVAFNTADVVRADLVDETTFGGTLGRPEAEVVSAGSAGVLTSTPGIGNVVISGETLFTIDDNPVVLLEGAVPSFRSLSLGDTQVTIPAGRNGTLTWLASEGQVVASGDIVAKIDDTPLIVLEGSLPMYRNLRTGVEGEDVQQLETALVSLGFDPDGEVTVDEEYTSSTSTMVKAWQESLGVIENGRVDLGDILFTPLPGQVLTNQAAVGLVVMSSTPLLLASGGDPLTGADILQLEIALKANGYETGLVDGVYDIATAIAVTSWTVDMGSDPTGWIPLGSLVFLPESMRVIDQLVSPGASVSPQTGVISAAPEQTIVRMDLPAEDQELIVVGSEVVIVLPDRSEVSAVVTSVATVAESSSQGDGATFAVEISLIDPEVVGDLDEAPVDIRVVSDSAGGVLAVPVSALLALAEGGYALEVVEGQATRLVAVEPGFFGDGLVEVTGSIDAGMTVVVP